MTTAYPASVATPHQSSISVQYCPSGVISPILEIYSCSINKLLLTMLRAEYDRWQTLAGLDEMQLIARTLPAGLSIKDARRSPARLAADIHRPWLEALALVAESALRIGLAGLEPDVEQNLEQIIAAVCGQSRSALAAGLWRRTGCSGLLDLQLSWKMTCSTRTLAMPAGRPPGLSLLRGKAREHHRESTRKLVAWLQGQDETSGAADVVEFEQPPAGTDSAVRGATTRKPAPGRTRAGAPTARWRICVPGASTRFPAPLGSWTSRPRNSRPFLLVWS